MSTMGSLLATLAIFSLAKANTIAQAIPTFSVPTNVTGSMTLYLPTPTPITSPPPGTPKKELSICCCCLTEPQPEVDHYMSECPRDGVRAVCGDDPSGDTGYTLGGLEGQPEKIARVCSTVRCGPVKFMD
ncbi:hypothetical protein F4776DRAFT_594597 [Hypoxylon sp. NC0597]|nr:hypothetical protein F4776DRAFT_594597 [Hypoxylon sp. NC0597]